MTSYEFHPWEIWNGGECPYPDELIQPHLDFQSRREAETNSVDYGRYWGWSEGGGIIAFRRVKKPETVMITGSAYLDWIFSDRKDATDTHRLIFEVVNGEPVNPRFERIK